MSAEENSKYNVISNSSTFQNYYSSYKSQFNDLDDQPCDVACLLCDSLYTIPTNKEDFICHLLKEHQLIIGDVYKIASLKSYIRYWRIKFKEQPITEFCTTLTMDSNSQSNKDNKSNQKLYFLLSDCLTEDKTLRDEIQRAKLEWVLSEQLKERIDNTFKRDCIFCRIEFLGSRIEYVNHLNQKHNILLGKPENLVFIDDYLDKIQNKIESYICIYCEKIFKNRFVLRKHMRKKLHKRVNPNNKIYDKYYVSNYLPDHPNCSKKKYTKLHIRHNEDSSGFSDNDDNWSDWTNENISITCLFCAHDAQDFTTILQHMMLKHTFDFEDISKEFTFYQKVKIVNYIRKQVHAIRCVYCDVNIKDLNIHMIKQNHYKLPERQIWDQPEFYFPMFENDSFLYNLDTNSDND
ncbi:PREDICTED: zinc finger protein 277 [Ceratosolen solmsi marchali]|uniref:Zinc finger protein 277 n=1 Tax=Ceratosolen solmsi marchali TaxID=326594 RepID=A0AAJ6YEE9_9HYME|nr:PREDICTED: zinc finger protein 277 [Ceratosolen solmsi marchali]